jgi:hypothetical protein
VALWVLAAAALRVWRLGQRPLTSDELWNLHVIGRDWPALLRLAAGDTFPPLSYVVLKLWAGSGACSDAALRAPAVVAGVACVPLVYLLGQTLVDRRAGLLAAGLWAISGCWLAQAQDARLYSLTTLWCLASWWAWARWRFGDGGGRALAGWFAATLLAVYTSYLAWPLVLGQNLVTALGRRPVERRWWLAQAGLGLAYLPWLALAAGGGGRAAGYMASRPPSSLGFALRKAFNALFEFGYGLASREHLAHLLAALALTALLAGLAWRARARPPRPLLAATAAVVPVAAVVLAAGARRQVPFERYLAAPAGALVLLWLAWALIVAPQGRLRAALITVAVALNLFAAAVTVRQPAWDYDFRPALAQLAAQARAGDGLLLDPPTDVLKVRRYLPPGLEARLAVPAEATFRDEAAYARYASELMAGGGRLWLLTAPCNAPVVPGRDLVARLRAQGPPLTHAAIGPLDLELFPPQAPNHAP